MFLFLIGFETAVLRLFYKKSQRGKKAKGVKVLPTTTISPKKPGNTKNQNRRLLKNIVNLFQIKQSPTMV